MLELSVYNDIAHLLTPWLQNLKSNYSLMVCKDERRYSMMNEEGNRNLEGYNQSQRNYPILLFLLTKWQI